MEGYPFQSQNPLLLPLALSNLLPSCSLALLGKFEAMVGIECASPKP